MRRMDDIRRKPGVPRATHTSSPAPAIEYHKQGLFGRKVKKLPRLLLSFREQIGPDNKRGQK